jgi:hypothetical protein
MRRIAVLEIRFSIKFEAVYLINLRLESESAICSITLYKAFLPVLFYFEKICSCWEQILWITCLNITDDPTFCRKMPGYKNAVTHDRPVKEGIVKRELSD